MGVGSGVENTEYTPSGICLFVQWLDPLPTNHLNLLLNPHNPENINTEVEKREEGEKEK